MNFVLIVGFASLFALTHMANGWVFQTFEISAHVGLVYMPAFLRLFNVLVLGPIKGSLATCLGGVMLLLHFNDEPLVGAFNIVCSLSGPLLALGFFRSYVQRPVNLGSLRDLLLLAVVSCVFNTLLHHVVWIWTDPAQVETPWQWLWMGLGDFAGCLIGVGLMKWAIDRFGLPPTAT